MNITLGSHYLKLDKWTNRAEMINYLNCCDQGNLIVGEDIYSNSSYYTISSYDNYGKFGIGIVKGNSDLSPNILLDYIHQNIIIGYDKSVCFINILNKQFFSKISLAYIFYQFYSLSHLGVRDFFLVSHEIGIVCIDYEGVERWSYISDEIISKVEIKENYLLLKFMDNLESEICLSITNGETISIT